MKNKIAVINDNPAILARFISKISNMILPSAEWTYYSTHYDPKYADLLPNTTVTQVDVKKDFKLFIDSGYDLIFSLHCKQIFPPELVETIKCINIHPGYNPINRGWYPQIFSIIYDLETGATIHEMNEKLDDGNIIDRKLVEKQLWDTSATLYAKIVDAEFELLEKNLSLILNDQYQTIRPEGDGNVFTKKDFSELCEVDLERNGKFIDFYNHLRALSHHEFNNSYFIDPVTKKKVYISIEVRTLD